MRVHIGPYPTFNSKTKKYTPPKRVVKVHIDKWDTWCMDSTLAYIIVPMLKQLKATKHGAPNIDQEDVPKNLLATAKKAKEGDIDTKFFKRWDWVLNEMIWAFEQVNKNWDEQFASGRVDYLWQPLDKDGAKIGKPLRLSNTKDVKGAVNYQMIQGPHHTYKIDRAGLEAHRKRMKNGWRLFGKYYSHLWD